MVEQLAELDVFSKSVFSKRMKILRAQRFAILTWKGPCCRLAVSCDALSKLSFLYPVFNYLILASEVFFFAELLTVCVGVCVMVICCVLAVFQFL